MNTNNKIQSNKMYCKVCADAKKPINEVTNHNVKSVQGVVLCPTLLSQECRYCKLSGHTVKFCKTLEEKKKFESKMQAKLSHETKNETKAIKTANTKTNTTANLFDALDSDSEDEKEENIQDKEYPVLGGAYYSDACINKLKSYSSALQTAPTTPQKQQLPKLTIIKTAHLLPSGKVSKWATAESSDDESDEEEEHMQSVAF
jgi:hypothetical protein